MADLKLIDAIEQRVRIIREQDAYSKQVGHAQQLGFTVEKHADEILATLRAKPPADPAPTADAVERAREKVARIIDPDVATLHWEGTEANQHSARLRACRERREQWGDEDCDKDGSCEECSADMSQYLETEASKQRRAAIYAKADAILAALQPRAVVGDAVRKAAQRVIDTRNANGAWNLDPDLDALEAALDAEPAVAGVVAVPREPTGEMIQAGQKSLDEGWFSARKTWSVMLAASPAKGGA